MPRRTRRHATPVPNLHFLTILVTAFLLVVTLLVYAVVPASKEALYITLAGALVGFLTGKLSNGFGKSMSLTPTVDASAEEDQAEDDTDAPAPKGAT